MPTRSRNFLRVTIDLILPALALWLIAHFGLVSIHNNAGELKIEDVILKIILPYLGVVTGVDLAMTLLGIFKDSTQTLFELLRMLVRRKPQAADSISSEFPYEVIAPEALPSRLPDLSHPDVPYVRRQPDGPYQEMIESMKGTQHLLILGRRGLGKTREAIELILRLQAESGEEVTVLLPQGPLDVPTSLPFCSWTICMNSMASQADSTVSKMRL